MKYKILIGGTVTAPDIIINYAVYKSGTIQLVTAVDVSGSELAVDELGAEVFYVSGDDVLFAPADYDGIESSDGYLLAGSDSMPDLTEVSYGTPAWLLENDAVIAKLYFVEATMTGAKLYSIKLMSAIGFLDREKHMGGVYASETVGDLIADIIGDRFVYSVEPAVASQLVKGWLPVGTRRENLHRLMFALGITLRKDASGDISFVFLYDSEGTFVPPQRKFSARVEYNAQVTAVNVTEHAYFKASGTAEEQVWSNETPVTDLLVEFQDPVYDLRADGLTVSESGDNYAVVSGAGTLYGKKYAHVTRVIRREVSGAAGKPNEVQVSNDGLISELNSESVAERLAAYYGARKTARLTVKLAGEKAGDTVSFRDSLGADVKGFVTQAVTRFSTFGKAQLKVIEGYVPGNQGNYYNSYVIVKGSDLVSGNWVVPSAMRGKQCRIVLFSGAQGGQGGWYGETKGLNTGSGMTRYYIEDNTAYLYGNLGTAQTGGKGGPGGKGGASATRILTIEIAALESSYPVSFGAGGEGGAGGTVVRDLSNGQFDPVLTPPEDGEPGADSTFGAQSTASGVAFGGSYYNGVTGEILAQAGESGVDGGDGGDGGLSLEYAAVDTYAEAQVYDYSTAGRGADGEAVGNHTGGAGADGVGVAQGYNNILNNSEGRYGNVLPYKFIVLSPAGNGGGGGAADGADGGAATAGKPRTHSVRYTDGTAGVYSGATWWRWQNYEDAWGEVYTVYTFDELSVAGDGADAVTIPAQAVYRGGKGGPGGGGCGGAAQPVGDRDWGNNSYADGNRTFLGQTIGGKGGNGGKGGKGSDGFLIAYFNA